VSGLQRRSRSLDLMMADAAPPGQVASTRDAELLGVMAAMVSRYLAAMGGRDDDVACAIDADRGATGEDSSSAPRANRHRLHPPVLAPAGSPEPGVHEASVQLGGSGEGTWAGSVTA